VRRIYHDNYWQAAACPELPPGLALFHFDAAVNQGVAGAARMLQQAVGSEVDGEIGPLTLAAVASQPVDEALAAYAEVRCQRYRALATFWRFGKGWLSRVDTTLALANEVNRSMPPLVPAQPKGPTPMPTDTQPTTPTPSAPDAKWWGNSMTIQGILVTTLSTVLPVLGPVLGLNITAELIHQLGDNVVTFGQAAGGLIGTVMAIYGRLRTARRWSGAKSPSACDIPSRTAAVPCILPPERGQTSRHHRGFFCATLCARGLTPSVAGGKNSRARPGRRG
jgi:lysozyme family protein